MAVRNAAYVIHDIQRDVISSFLRPAAPHENSVQDGPTKRAEIMQILLEESDDNLEFAELVRAEIMAQDATAGAIVQIVPSLQQATARERQRYLAAGAFAWSMTERQALLEQLATAGYRTAQIDAAQAFDHVKLITLVLGEVLIEAGDPAAFVYVPLDVGLKVFPMGGYGSLTIQPWMPLGVTGVIRGATRNATIRAEQTVRLLMIPKMVFLKHWHHPHTLTTFLAAVSNKKQSADCAD